MSKHRHHKHSHHEKDEECHFTLEEACQIGKILGIDFVWCMCFSFAFQ